MRSLLRICVLLTLISFAATSASRSYADLIITEAMSSSGAGGTVDWFELTNSGAAAVDITGYRVDDSSATFGLSQPLSGITSINPGESVVFIESAGGAEVASFKTFWNLSASVQVGYYSGSGLGLSSGGDAVNVFNATPDPGSIIANNAFPAATPGTSFVFTANGTPADLAGLSVASENGAYATTGATINIGSPGFSSITAIPEPTSLALLGVTGAIGLLVRRRAK